MLQLRKTVRVDRLGSRCRYHRIYNFASYGPEHGGAQRKGKQPFEEGLLVFLNFEPEGLSVTYYSNKCSILHFYV